jgi:hypothetical protein
VNPDWIGLGVLTSVMIAVFWHEISLARNVQNFGLRRTSQGRWLIVAELDLEKELSNVKERAAAVLRAYREGQAFDVSDPRVIELQRALGDQIEHPRGSAARSAPMGVDPGVVTPTVAAPELPSSDAALAKERARAAAANAKK